MEKNPTENHDVLDNTFVRDDFLEKMKEQSSAFASIIYDKKIDYFEDADTFAIEVSKCIAKMKCDPTLEELSYFIEHMQTVCLLSDLGRVKLASQTNTINDDWHLHWDRIFKWKDADHSPYDDSLVHRVNAIVKRINHDSPPV